LFDCGFGEITDWGTTRLSVTTNRYYVELVFCKQGLKALGRTVSIFFSTIKSGFSFHSGTSYIASLANGISTSLRYINRGGFYVSAVARRSCSRGFR